MPCAGSGFAAKSDPIRLSKRTIVAVIGRKLDPRDFSGRATSKLAGCDIVTELDDITVYAADRCGVGA
jgi:hypothetical protein